MNISSNVVCMEHRSGQATSIQHQWLCGVTWHFEARHHAKRLGIAIHRLSLEYKERKGCPGLGPPPLVRLVLWMGPSLVRGCLPLCAKRADDAQIRTACSNIDAVMGIERACDGRWMVTPCRLAAVEHALPIAAQVAVDSHRVWCSAAGSAHECSAIARLQ